MSDPACSRIVAIMARETPPAPSEDLCTAAEIDAGDAAALARPGALRAITHNRRQAM